MSDVYVVGSGPTLNYIDPSFFDGKEVVAVNYAGDRLGIHEIADVTVHTHYHNEAHALATKYPQSWVWTPEGDAGHSGSPPADSPPNVIYYPHPPTRFDFDVAKASLPEGLLVGSTSAHGAIHLACKAGARNVILVGLDCGLLDGETNHGDHPLTAVPDARPPLEILTRWDTHLRQVKAWLLERYPVNIYSLNPFVNLNLEGHEWSGVRQ